MLYVVQERKSHWEISIAKTKSKLARAKQDLNNAYRNADLQGIIDNTNIVDNLQDGLEIAEAAFVVLFPVEV